VSAYLDRLLAGRAGRDDVELVWELTGALEDKRASGQVLSAAERLAWQACSVSTCDGIAGLVADRPGDIAAVAAFAQARGLPKTAAMLADAARGVPVGGGVQMSTQFGGKTIPVEIPQTEWGATDLALSLVDEDLDAAILDYVAQEQARFDLVAPAAVQAREALADRIAALAGSSSAAELLARFAARPKGRLHACLSEYDRSGDEEKDCLDLPVMHEVAGPADAARIAALRKQYGAPADALLDAYALHDGAALYIVGDAPGFHFLPLSEWEAHADDVMSWAQNVTWSDEPDELPPYLETAIAFGYTPGDSERWILITEGPWAGQVMLSDTDAIEDAPRYASIAAFFAALTLDIENVLGNGGFVSYMDGKTDGLYYPVSYSPG
jgi:hypothetical protein